MPKDPYKEATDPSFGRRLLEGLIAAAGEYKHPGRGITLLDIMQQKRKEQAVGDLLRQIGEGVQLAGPPTAPGTAARNLFEGGVPPSDIVGRINAGDLGGAPQPSSEMNQGLLTENLFKIASIPGADVNKAMQFLQATGKLQDPVAKRQQELETQKQKGRLGYLEKSFDFKREIAQMQNETRQETNALKAEWNKIIRNKNAQEREQREADWVIKGLNLKAKLQGAADKGFISSYEDVRRQYYDSHGGDLTGFPTFEAWKQLPENRAQLPQNLESDESFLESLKTLQGKKSAPAVAQPIKAPQNPKLKEAMDYIEGKFKRKEITKAQRDSAIANAIVKYGAAQK